jgi:hypothetical protein
VWKCKKESENSDTDTTESDDTAETNLDSDPPDSDIMGISSETESFINDSDMASTYDEEFILQEIRKI